MEKRRSTLQVTPVSPSLSFVASRWTKWKGQESHQTVEPVVVQQGHKVTTSLSPWTKVSSPLPWWSEFASLRVRSVMGRFPLRIGVVFLTCQFLDRRLVTPGHHLDLVSCLSRPKTSPHQGWSAVVIRPRCVCGEQQQQQQQHRDRSTHYVWQTSFVYSFCAIQVCPCTACTESLMGKSCVGWGTPGGG